MGRRRCALRCRTTADSGGKDSARGRGDGDPERRGGRCLVSRPGVDGTVGSRSCGRIQPCGRRAAGVRLHQLGPVYNRGPEKLRRRGQATWRRRRRRRCAGSEPAVPKRSNTVLWRCSKGRGRRAWRGSVHLAGAAAFTRQDNPGGLRRRGGKQRCHFQFSRRASRHRHRHCITNCYQLLWTPLSPSSAKCCLCRSST